MIDRIRRALFYLFTDFDEFLWRLKLRTGFFEVERSFIIKRALRKATKPICFIDAGANVGQTTEKMLKSLPENSVFILVEPNPHCVAILQEKFDCLPNIKIIAKALSNAETNLTLFGDFENNALTEGASLRQRSEGLGSISVETIRLEELLCQQNFEAFDIIIKIDIEGEEYNVLQDLKVQPVRVTPLALFVEYHDTKMCMSKEDRKRAREIRLTRRLNGAPIYRWH